MQEQMIQEQANQILAMIGPHGVLSIICTIFAVRMIRALGYTEKRESALISVLVGMIAGLGFTYSYVPDATGQQLFAGAFMTPFASMVAYEALRWGVAWAYGKLEWEILYIFYFFLCPRSIKTKKEGKVTEVPPHPDLTTFMNKVRLDKK